METAFYAFVPEKYEILPNSFDVVGLERLGGSANLVKYSISEHCTCSNEFEKCYSSIALQMHANILA